MTIKIRIKKGLVVPFPEFVPMTRKFAVHVPTVPPEQQIVKAMIRSVYVQALTDHCGVIIMQTVFVPGVHPPMEHEFVHDLKIAGGQCHCGNMHTRKAGFVTSRSYVFEWGFDRCSFIRHAVLICPHDMCNFQEVVSCGTVHNEFPVAMIQYDESIRNDVIALPGRRGIEVRFGDFFIWIHFTEIDVRCIVDKFLHELFSFGRKSWKEDVDSGGHW